MKKTKLELPEIKLIGISVRTSYKQELDKMRGNIFPCVQHYFHGALFEKIPNRKRPGTTFCVYTDYESDSRQKYTVDLPIRDLISYPVAGPSRRIPKIAYLVLLDIKNTQFLGIIYPGIFSAYFLKSLPGIMVSN